MGPLFAVHLTDGAVATPWWVGGFAGLTLLLAFALRGLSDREVPRVGVLTAAFFVGSSAHVPLGVVPTSAHLILNGLVGVVLGRRAVVAVVVGLGLQYLLLAHGGLTTLGLNACVVGVPAVVAGWAYPVLRRRLSAWATGAVLGAGAAAGAVGLNFAVLYFGGKDDWPALAKLVLLAHVPIIVIEGLLLGVVVQYLDRVKPEMLAAHAGNTSSNGTSH